MKFRIPFVHNVRRGLATNSSSSHSLVYFDEPRPDHDSEESVSGVDPEFGWDTFKLTTRREKLMYALVSILQRDGANDRWAGGRTDSDSVDMDRYAELFPDLAGEIETARGGYVDHQSVVGDPEQLIKAALDPYVEIWGGNDNGDDPHEDYVGYNSTWDRVIDREKSGHITRVEYLG